MKKRSITTQKVISYFREQGEELTEEDAEETLDLMYFLSEHIVKRIKVILRKKERIRSRLKRHFIFQKNSATRQLHDGARTKKPTPIDLKRHF
jgi:hypothetical protein